MGCQPRPQTELWGELLPEVRPEVGLVVWARPAGFFKPKIRPAIILRTNLNSSATALLTSSPTYCCGKQRGNPRVPLNLECGVGGYLWSLRPTPVRHEDVIQEVGYLDEEALLVLLENLDFPREALVPLQLATFNRRLPK